MIPAVAHMAMLAVVGAQVVAGDGEVTLVVDANGTTIQLPEPVTVVTPVQQYTVRPVAPPSPKQGEPAGPVDVRVFLVTPRGRAAPERVTFLFASGRSVAFALSTGAATDNYIEVKWAKKASTRSDNFLSSERALMLAMMRDEGAGRQVVDERVEWPDYPILQATLVRTFVSEGLKGYVYTFMNVSDKTLEVSFPALAIGRPNRAVLTQMDHTTLKPCNVDNGTAPRGTGCMSAVRLVARETGLRGKLLVDSRMPFVRKLDRERP